MMRTRAEDAPHYSEHTIFKMQFNPMDEWASDPAYTRDIQKDRKGRPISGVAFLLRLV
jgi:hypothetical protein